MLISYAFYSCAAPLILKYEHSSLFLCIDTCTPSVSDKQNTTAFQVMNSSNFFAFDVNTKIQLLAASILIPCIHSLHDSLILIYVHGGRCSKHTGR